MDALSNASAWLIGLLSGSVAAVLAIVAVAGLGFVMLQGRLPVRRALSTLGGIFLLFGAPALAKSLIALAPHNALPGDIGPVRQAADVITPYQVAPADDPYAGAALRR